MKPRFETRHSGCSAITLYGLSHLVLLPHSLLSLTYLLIYSIFSSPMQHINPSLLGGRYLCMRMCVCISINDLHNITYFFKANPIALLLHANLSQILHSRGQSGPIHYHWFFVRTGLPHRFPLIILHTLSPNGCWPKAEDS